jgi:hypothetical protein
VCASPQAAHAFIAGVWRQSDADCAGAVPVRELIFRGDGTYSVTWTPFETYKDYWGRWRYEAKSHVLTLTADGGNYQPADRVLSGAINVTDHELELGRLSLGSPQNGGRCMAPFRR